MVKMIKGKNVNGEVFFLPCIVELYENVMGYIREAKVSDIEVFEVDSMKLEDLPADVQNEVRSILKAYSSANVVYEYGKFRASSMVGIKSSYNWDHFVCGSYKAVDVYSKEERRQNYFESFGYYPCF